MGPLALPMIFKITTFSKGVRPSAETAYSDLDFKKVKSKPDLTQDRFKKIIMLNSPSDPDAGEKMWRHSLKSEEHSSLLQRPLVEIMYNGGPYSSRAQ